MDKNSGSSMQFQKHGNVTKNFLNIELFHKNDLEKEDCIGWITIMDDKSQGIIDGYRYLDMVGIIHMDLKMDNSMPNIIDLDLITERTGRKSYREMGFSRRGSKYRKVSI